MCARWPGGRTNGGRQSTACAGTSRRDVRQGTGQWSAAACLRLCCTVRRHVTPQRTPKKANARIRHSPSTGSHDRCVIRMDRSAPKTGPTKCSAGNVPATASKRHAAARSTGHAGSRRMSPTTHIHGGPRALVCIEARRARRMSRAVPCAPISPRRSFPCPDDTIPDSTAHVPQFATHSMSSVHRRASRYATRADGDVPATHGPAVASACGGMMVRITHGVRAHAAIARGSSVAARHHTPRHRPDRAVALPLPWLGRRLPGPRRR